MPYLYMTVTYNFRHFSNGGLTYICKRATCSASVAAFCGKITYTITKFCCRFFPCLSTCLAKRKSGNGLNEQAPF